ncbi:MAG: glycosyltransferase family 39 protein [Patescibacteria group bacterium]|nr:glycosyltransferase family 39 protein [Patescibacteria group bacterium]
MEHKKTSIIAFFLISIMAVTAFLSYQNDALTMDEQSHIPAGYSYLAKQDFRINPEHPPLIKDLAALPLMFLDLNFPDDSYAWNQGVNEQWVFGAELLYQSGNDADKMIFWARIPMILMLVSLAWFLFYWTRKEFGNKVSLIVLSLFTFSPSFIAHGRLVATDVGATLGVVLATYFWLKFLRNPSKKNVIKAGLVFGFTMLLKFSLVLLIPFFGIITVVYALLKKQSLLKYILLSTVVGLIGTIFVILPVYYFHTLNYPVEKQLADTSFILADSPIIILKDIVIWMADKPILRSIGHYLLGLVMAVQRTGQGNTAYFMNMISNTGWWYYFPVVYLLKVPLSFHILALVSFLLTLLVVKKPFWIDIINRTKECISENFTAFSMTLFLIIYWLTSITGNLNIGVRHVLPVFPFTYILVSIGLIKGFEKIGSEKLKNALNFTIIALVGWYALSSVNVYPHYLSYFNEIKGGTDNGYKYVVDSNYDWGQDLKRLTQYINENNIEKMKIDYFGGGNVDYYLGDNWERLDSSQGPQEGWLAISLTLLQGGRGDAVPGFPHSSGYYKWLDDYQPVTRAGKSIFIYNIPENSFVLKGR